MGHTAMAMGNGGMLIMFNYEKRLEFPINIKQTNAQMATAIITQFGGPNGETGAAMRYLSQRFAMPYQEVMGILTDVGTEASKMYRHLHCPENIIKFSHTSTVRKAFLALP